MLTGSSVEAAVLASVSAASSRALPSSPLSRQAERRLVPRQQPGAVGGQQPDKADKPRHADNGGNRHGGKRQQQQTHRTHPHTEQPASPSSIESSSACRCSAKIAAQQTSTTGTGNHTRLRVTAARLPMIQYSMLASSFSGSAVSLSSISSVWASAWTAMPASTSDILLRPGRGSGQPQREEHRRQPARKGTDRGGQRP